MARTVAIGEQNFEEIIQKNCFYIDKTMFIKEWWESRDSVTLITRPRRFGKTLNMSMLEYFFSVEHAGQGRLFDGLAIWQEEEYRQMQGTYPVISLSFARVKDTRLEDAIERIREIIRSAFRKKQFLRDSDVLAAEEKAYFDRILSDKASEVDVTSSLYHLSDYLYRYYGKKVIILLDEYDTPMQEAYLGNYWDGLTAFTRSLFNSAFKTNPYLARGIMTGITRVSKESIFSDLNHLEVVTTTSNKYTAVFGFTEEEVFTALDEYGLSKDKEIVKYWYDGFTFGKQKDIYNPWSIINLLDKGEIGVYWANTSSNSLAGKLLREGNRDIKEMFEILLKGESLKTQIEEQIVYNQLGNSAAAVWSLLLASGYLKVLDCQTIINGYDREWHYELAITNHETRRMFEGMVSDWFRNVDYDYNEFIKAMLADDIDMMNLYMNRVALNSFSCFDTGNRPSDIEPERFYHGFVLGLLVDLQKEYVITSNRESGFGRYDVMIEPKDVSGKAAVILEFKVMNERREATLEDTVQAALRQIEEKQYAAQLMARGFPKERIRYYGFAFRGKEILIG
ncbi:MAG: AAA family ATPase [Lachnospiraceae bacterium]|nr:AAA family ATPase [Lachnospiraceae bacterium]